MSETENQPTPDDPIKQGAKLAAGDDYLLLERRLKQDIFNSLCRIKPDLGVHDFESEIMSGSLFPSLSAPLQGIAIARVEGALAFYNRVGWSPAFLGAHLAACVEEPEKREILKTRYHAKDMHDLAYVHPKHFEKIFGKVGAAALWEKIKTFSKTSVAE